MATFVLVHGGWTGAHGWRAVRRLLREQEHDVFTPSLTGIGERAHLTSPQVNAFWDAAEHAQSSDRWQYHKIATSHMVPSNRPGELVAVLAGLA